MMMMMIFRVLTLFSENCSYNTLRFIFIILLPVKAAWSHDDDDDDEKLVWMCGLAAFGRGNRTLTLMCGSLIPQRLCCLDHKP